MNSAKIKSNRTSNPSARRTRFAIFRYNDPHGNTDMVSGMLQACKLFKEKNTLNKDVITITASGGDNVSGGDVKKNSFVFDLMKNMAGLEVSAVGNHELDATASGFYEAAKDKNITFVATNINMDSTNPMTKFVKKSLIKKQNGVKYGFVGAMPIDFESCTKKESQVGLKVQDMDQTIASLQQEINNLKAQGVNKIFLLSHVGYETDKKLASSLDGIDVIIGGHTHSLIEDTKVGENLVKSKSGEPVLITQTGENGKYYGIVNVEFDDNGVLTNVQNSTNNSHITYKTPIVEHIKDQKLGKSPVIGKISKIDPMPKNRRIQLCAWTDVLADSMKTMLDTDIAIVNAANTRKVPQVGLLTQRDVSESSPMKNKLLKTKITQKQLVQAVKNAAKTSMSSKEGEPGLLHLSGVTYKIDKSGNLLEICYIDKQNQKHQIDINNPSETITYTACYDNFVSKAGGEYPELEPKFNFEQFDFDKDETMINYLSKRPDKDNLVITNDNRIEIV